LTYFERYAKFQSLEGVREVGVRVLEPVLEKNMARESSHGWRTDVGTRKGQPNPIP
jgi:hypothetical protein